MPLLDEVDIDISENKPSAFSRQTSLDDLLGVKSQSPQPDYSFQDQVINEFKRRHKKIPKLDQDSRELAFYGATGTGKTRVGADCLLAGNTGVWFAHTEELRNQALEAIRDACSRAGQPPESCAVISVSTPAAAVKWIEGQKDSKTPIRYAVLSIGELGRDTEQQQKKLQLLLDHIKPEVAICDEAHHCQQGLEADKELKGGTFDRVSSAALAAGATLLQLSATPVRHNVKVGDKFETRELALGQVIGSIGISEAIRQGLLAEIVLARQSDPRSIPRGGRNTLSPQEASALMAGIIANPSPEEKGLLEEMSKAHPHLPERHRLLYFMDRNQLSLGGNTTEEKLDLTRDTTCNKAFQESGKTRRIATGSLSGNHARISVCDPSINNGELQTHEVSRADIKKMFEQGELDALLNYGVLTEGVDLPMASMLIINRDTKSSKLSTQILGRILRSFMGSKKQAFIIDPVHLFAQREIIDLVTHLPNAKSLKKVESENPKASTSRDNFQLSLLIEHILPASDQGKKELPTIKRTEDVLAAILDRRPDSKAASAAVARVLHHVENSPDLSASEISNANRQIFGDRRKVANYLASWQSDKGTGDRAHLEGVSNNPMLDHFVEFCLECNGQDAQNLDSSVTGLIKELQNPESSWLADRQAARQSQRLTTHPELALGGLFLQLQSCDILQGGPEERSSIIGQIEAINSDRDPSPEYLLDVYRSLRKKNPTGTVVHKLQRQDNGRYSCTGCHTALSNRSSNGQLDFCEHCTSLVIFG